MKTTAAVVILLSFTAFAYADESRALQNVCGTASITNEWRCQDGCTFAQQEETENDETIVVYYPGRCVLTNTCTLRSQPSNTCVQRLCKCIKNGTEPVPPPDDDLDFMVCAPDTTDAGDA